MDLVDASFLPAFCDYDQDGDLDCYLLTNRYYRDGGLPADLQLIVRHGKVALPTQYERYYAVRSTSRNQGELKFIGRPDRLLRNESGRHFVDVTRPSGIRQTPGHGLSVTWWDFDHDGDCDLYVANDFEDRDYLYRNEGDGTFVDVLESTVPHTTWFSMGADFGDINNDGRFDFLVADMSATTHFGEKTTMGAMGQNAWFLEFARPPQYMRNAFYLNTGSTRFLEIAYLSGVASSDWTWSVKFADFDLDGLLDLYLTNGMSRNLNDSDLPYTMADHIGKTKWDLYEHLPPMLQQNLAYRNQGDLRFEDVSKAWRLDHLGMSFGAAVGDLDRDGDLDLVVANLDEPVSLYRNDATTGNRLLLKLSGTQSNPAGIGATATVSTEQGTQVRQLIPTRGFLASDEPVLHFGLGEANTITSLQVQWPSGCVQQFRNLTANRIYHVRESVHASADDSSPGGLQTSRPMYALMDGLPATKLVHRELRFDDFATQPLLPNRLSQLGPGIAIADVDRDGDQDIYLSGAAGQAGSLAINEGQGQFRVAGAYPFRQDAASEDTAPLFLDYDGDGDLDLFVVSGGVEHPAGHAALADRLYQNDGRGHFFKAPRDHLPDSRDSGSCVAAADFDRDGDVDLFVGGRVIPGRYPLAPGSRLLRNLGGKFEDATERLAPELSQTGMATSAVWTDADNDGWIDLLIAHEWGAIEYFQNQQGRLRRRTDAAGLNSWRGWWNGLSARDIDGDNDVDFVATNFGWNTKYHASHDHPALLYYGDFDDSGGLRIVEAEYENDQLYPIRGRSCSSRAMPFIRQKFGSFESFALATLSDVYSDECLAESHRFSATTLSSAVFLNDGRGSFQYQPLPVLAQVAPGFGVRLTEINGDGYPDLYLVQNFFGPQVETGRMDGGLSLLLAGGGDGQFRPIGPSDSGLVIAGDATALAELDIDNNGWPDFLVGINDAACRLFRHQAPQINQPLRVRLEGPAGNPTGIGARLTLRMPNGKTQTAELTAGGSYWSQSSSAVTFGLGRQPDFSAIEIEVRWPTGEQSFHRLDDQQVHATLSPAQPTGVRP